MHIFKMYVTHSQSIEKIQLKLKEVDFTKYALLTIILYMQNKIL